MKLCWTGGSYLIAWSQSSHYWIRVVIIKAALEESKFKSSRSLSTIREYTHIIKAKVESKAVVLVLGYSIFRTFEYDVSYLYTYYCLLWFIPPPTKPGATRQTQTSFKLWLTKNDSPDTHDKVGFDILTEKNVQAITSSPSQWKDTTAMEEDYMKWRLR